jgi:hypothetical protein
MQASNNYLLIRSDVGQTRPGVHVLPPATFAYGKKSGEDSEGARDLIKKWKVHEPSKDCLPELDFISLNNKSISKGFSTSTQFRIYKKSQHLRPSVSQNYVKNKSIATDTTYGVPLRPATPIKAVIGNFYGRVASEVLHDNYAVQGSQTLGKYSSTRGFELLKASKYFSNQEKKNDEFKMKKFSSVKTRTDCWRK